MLDLDKKINSSEWTLKKDENVWNIYQSSSNTLKEIERKMNIHKT